MELQAPAPLVANPFMRSPESYIRDINIIQGMVDQYTAMLSKTYKQPADETREWVLKELESGNRRFIDPIFYFLDKDEHGDKFKSSQPFTKYLEHAVREGNLMAPTFAQVMPHERKESLLSSYIKVNLAKRSEEKKKQFAAKSHGDNFRANLHQNNQNNKKILNNAISGNHRSEHSILYDRSIHPILTSCCRIANGSANANNERLLAGARHYYTPDIVLENIASIITLHDMAAFSEMIDRFNLHIPTVEETLWVVRKSSDKYFNAPVGIEKIVILIEGLSDYERAAVVYTGDMYHLRVFNDALVRDIFDALVEQPNYGIQNHFEWLNHVDEDTVAQLKICFPAVSGKEHFWHPDAQAHPDYPLVGTMAYQIWSKLAQYDDLIIQCFCSRNVPPVISDFPHAIREVGVGSDTDSAIFTVQEWAIWYSGNDNVDYRNMKLAEAVAFVVSQTTTHNLAVMTGNMGVVDAKERFRLSMKNEYFFPVFALTSRAKHYFATRLIQEGVIIDPIEYEIKGVELIASNTPDEIRKDIKRTMKEILDNVGEGNKISLNQILRRVARWEHVIHESIMAGETVYLKAARVKEEDGYTEENSRFINYLMWQDVFADKYGETEAPPYSALQFTITPDTKNKTEKWLSAWADQPRAERMRQWLASRGKVYVGEVLLPETCVMSAGIPEEIQSVIDVRKIVAKAVSPFYLILESLEYYCFDEKQNKLLMDVITREESEAGAN